MASIFSHGLVAYTITKINPFGRYYWKLVIACILCSMLPDADVIMFDFGFAYEHPLGHRGFFHSPFFAAIVALIVSIFFNLNNKSKKQFFGCFLLIFICTASHGLLDGMTNGGRGVAYFAPFNNERYFLPWRPIHISPIGAQKFFSEWGLRVIYSEMKWIGIPCALILIFIRFFKK